MKFVSAPAMVLIISLLISGCGESGTSHDSPSTHVCVATDAEGLTPHTFNRLAVDGAQSTGVAVQTVASRSASDYLSSLQRCVAARPMIVIAVTSDMATAVWRAAQLHPNQRFALIDAAPIDENGQSVDLDNVADLLFNEQEPGYLVGALAGLMETNKVGSVSHNVLGIFGSNHGPNVDPYIAGYVAGAKSVDPTVTFTITYSDSQQADYCKTLGMNQIRDGADILFEVAGRCSSGYIDAAYDAGAYAIGSDNDLAYASPAVITSALKRVDRAVAIMIRRLQNGQFKSGKQVFSLQDDATGFSTPSSVVPQDLINQVLDIRSKIRSGAITPPSS